MDNRALGIILIVIGAIWAFTRMGAIEGPSFLVVLGAIFVAAYFATGYRTPLLIAGSVISAVGLFSQLGGEGYLFFIFLAGAFAAVYIVEHLVGRNSTWALYPAGALAAFGVFVMAVQHEEYLLWLPSLWPIVLIALGLILLFPRRR